MQLYSEQFGPMGDAYIKISTTYRQQVNRIHHRQYWSGLERLQINLESLSTASRHQCRLEMVYQWHAKLAEGLDRVVLYHHCCSYYNTMRLWSRKQ